MRLTLFPRVRGSKATSPTRCTSPATASKPWTRCAGAARHATSDEDRDKVEAYKLNVAGYIVKPVTLSAFVEIMVTLNKYWTVSELP